MLREILRQQRQFRHGHNAEFLAFDEQFQRALDLFTGRAYAWRTIENIKAQMDRTRYLSLDDATPIPLLIKRTSRLSMPIESCDPDAASAAVRTHMQQIVPSLPEIARKFPDMFESRRTA